MNLYLDTSTPVCKLTLSQEDERFDYDWQADRGLADGLIGFLRQKLINHNATWRDVTAIAVYKGPGSFTGLRIGLTVINTLASELRIPIVGETGEDWQRAADVRLKEGQNDQLVMPLYGREANITTPRK